MLFLDSMKKHIVVFTGAGISAESGINTFRDSNGLWENHKISDVATPEAWYKNPKLVLNFYNERRKQVIQAKPNQAHIALVELEKYFKISIITQNVDDLHERANSSSVLHLHGEIRKVRSTKNPNLVYQWEKEDVFLGDKCELGSQLRPHIVWFGEAVPNFEKAIHIVSSADIFVVIGSSLSVYPAASLVDYTPNNCKKYVIDPGIFSDYHLKDVTHIKERAVVGVSKLRDKLLKSC